MLNRRDFLTTLAAAPLANAAAERPNIVLIMADDMGFSDIGCYGGEIRTPNLDGLSKGGLRFTQFYNCARCCPTRASLMTGLYPHQAGVGHMVNPRPYPAYAGDLSRNAVTIPEVLKSSGYRTWMAGKWHVTPVTDKRHNWPTQRGFEKFFGTIHGAGSFYDPTSLAEGNEFIKPEGKDFYYTDAIADKAASYIRGHGASAEPFFLYTAFTSPHWPMHALEEDIERYKNRYKDGWDALRQERHARMIKMGVVDRKWPLTARDEAVPAWKDAPNKEWEARRMAVFAAMIDRMDQGIGRITAALRATGKLDNTLILFLADNGGCAETFPLRVTTNNPSIPKTTRDGRPVRAGNDPSIMPGKADDYQSYGVGWANASNTPFRMYKHWVHEGGISSPLIAHWPRAIKKTGGFTAEPSHLIDVMATAADVSGARYPAEFSGNKVTPLEGKSLKPVFESGKRSSHSEIYWEHEGNRAVRQGKWKLVLKHGSPWELYDLDADRTELQDLSAKQAGKAAELKSKWEAWAAKAGVVDWDQVRRS